MDIGSFIGEMDRIAPPDLADEFDEGRIGLIVEGAPEIGTVACALDATPRVIGKAVEAGTDALVVHHTPIWYPVTRVGGALGGMLRHVLAARMNVVVIHSNFDRAPGGVNDVLARRLGLTDLRPMSLGIVGDCLLSPAGIAGRLGGGVRVTGDVEMPCRLAVVGGSGFDPVLIKEAVSLGATAFLSAELKHSVARDAPVPCIEATHYALEAPAMEELAGRMGWIYIDDPPHTTLIP